MTRMTLEQANEHFRLQHQAQLKAETLAEAKSAWQDAEYASMRANANLYNFELALEKDGIDVEA